MRELQLFIEGERIDLFKDETVSLTQTIQNARDIGSIFTDFSKSFSLPASAANNKLFKHYYDFEIIGGFNANDKKRGEILLNSFLFRKGFIALDGVSLKDNKPHTYKITFFGETVDIKKKLQAVTLQNIFESTSAYNHDYNLANVKAGLQTNVPNITDVIYPLISHTERFYYDTTTEGANTRNLHYKSPGTGTKNHGVDYTDLKPAIKLTAILDRIEAFTEENFGVGNGLVFETGGVSFFNTSYGVNYNEIYDKMFLWMSRAKGVLGKSYTGETLTTIVITDMTNPNAGWDAFCYRFQSSYPACENSRITDGVWRIKPVRIFQFNQPSLDFAVEWKVVGSGGGTFSLSIEDITGQTVVISSATGLAADGTTEHTISTSYLGTVGIFSNIRFVLTATSGTFSYTTNLILEKRFGEEISSTPVRQYTYAYCDITNVFPTGALDKVVAGDQMPKMLVIDYLTSLFKMFNLTAFVQEDGKIMVQTLNSYYDGGNSIDISEFIDTTAGSVDFAPPYQDIAFRNVAPKTFFATNFFELNGTVFGDLASSTNVDGVQTTDRGNRYVVQTGFEKLIYERFPDTNIQWGWSVDKDQKPIVTQPMIFIKESTTTSANNPISFIDGSSSGTAAFITFYNRPANSLNVETINFGAEIDEYTGTVKLDSLFQEQYLRYISGVFDLSRRLTKVTAYLPLNITLSFSLADTFIINGKGYKINSIDTDLQTGKSKLELYNNVDF